MHTDIHYKGPDAEEKALKDIREWFGDQKFTDLEALFLHEEKSPEQFAMWLSVGGVTGYPVRVWYKKLYGKEFVLIET